MAIEEEIKDRCEDNINAARDAYDEVRLVGIVDAAAGAEV